MSFISILKNIGQTALGIERAAAPIVSVVLPQFSPAIAAVDGIVLKLQSSILTAEANAPTDGQGALKAQSVIADFSAGLGLTQSVLALKRERLDYDQGALQEAINAQVAAYNAFAKLKASFKVVPIS